MFFSILIQFNLISDFCFFCSKGRPRPCPFWVYNCHYKILCKFRFLSLLHHHFFCNSRLLFLLHQREGHTHFFFLKKSYSIFLTFRLLFIPHQSEAQTLANFFSFNYYQMFFDFWYFFPLHQREDRTEVISLSFNYYSIFITFGIWISPRQNWGPEPGRILFHLINFHSFPNCKFS